MSRLRPWNRGFIRLGFTEAEVTNPSDDLTALPGGQGDAAVLDDTTDGTAVTTSPQMA